jgi:predicted RNA binding protein YcfA (HicA-like mRNA interferase family)
MVKGFLNWTAEDVIRVLKDYKFVHTHTKGSHMFYTGHFNGQLRQACVPFHGSRILKPKTLQSIIRQSGISKNDWLGR